MGALDATIIAAVVAATIPALVALSRLLRDLIHGKPEPTKTYAERLSDLTSSLTSASAEVDSVLTELSAAAKEKEASLEQLEQGLNVLAGREKELQDRVATLENVPLPVAKHLAKMMEPREKRSAKRDYVLFGAGVLVTAAIAIVIQLISG